MQTEITTEYIRQLQQTFRERAWTNILKSVEDIQPTLEHVHRALLVEVRSQPRATQYTVYIGTIRVDALLPEDIRIEDIKEKFLDCYSMWMDRYVPSAHVEVKLGYPFVEVYFVFSL